MTPPDCSRDNPRANNGCGSKLAYAYFLSFSVVGQFIMLNLFVGAPPFAHPACDPCLRHAFAGFSACGC